MRNQMRFSLVLAGVVLLGSLLCAQVDSAYLEKMTSLLDSKSIVFFAAKAPGEPNGYVGIQYLKGVSIIVIHSVVDPDNAEFVNADLGEKSYRKVYKDLSMMKGNRYTVIFDFQNNNLEIGEASGDFIKENDKVIYLNKTFEENGYPTLGKYSEAVGDYQAKFTRWLKVVESALK